ncbi:hypothetical protein [Nevskia sp.]|uniref:hypothetical protein n=1 Tax=Nevskia sp. TaxID=1929292 RepID=UPI00260072AA|nr:hypothetical protein [Nevskia sp.]
MRDRSYVMVDPSTGEAFRETRIGGDRRSSLPPTREEKALAVVRFAGSPRVSVTFPTEDPAFGPEWLAFSVGPPTVLFIPAVKLELQITPSIIVQGQAVTLSWTSRNADELIAEGAWSGMRAASGQEDVVIDTVGLAVFKLTATGPGGIAFASVSAVVSSEIALMLTSQHFPVYVVESLDITNPDNLDNSRLVTEPIDGMDISNAIVTSGVLQQTFFLVTYGNYPAEGFDITNAVVTGGVLQQTFFLRTYDTGAPEGFDISNAIITAGTLMQTFFLVEYMNYPAEGFDISNAIITSGTLS